MVLLPPDLAVAEAVALVLTSGFASLMTAVLGIGGGMLMLAVMAQLLPIAVLIPAHGIVQLGSNGNRAFMTREHIDWPLVKMFVAGALLASLIAFFVVVQLPVGIMELTVALFILWLTWGPKPKGRSHSPARFSLLGFFTTFLTMFVGATGPLVAASVHHAKTNKLEGIASFSACMTVQNLLKVAVFSFVGFSFTAWLPLLAAMVGAGALGTWVGLHLQKRMPGERFQLIFKVSITALALRLLWQAVHNLPLGLS